jgi:hypothetical protein
MKSVYVVLAYRYSPIYITHPKPVAAFATRKEAQAFVTQKNNRAVANDYGVVRVPFGSKQ